MRAGILLAMFLIGCGGEEFAAGPGGAGSGAAGSGGTQSTGSGGDAGISGESGAVVVGGGEPCDGVNAVCDKRFFCDPETRRCIEPFGGGGEGGGGPIEVHAGDACDDVEFVCDEASFCESETCIPKIEGGLGCDFDFWCVSGACDKSEPRGFFSGSCA